MPDRGTYDAADLFTELEDKGELDIGKEEGQTTEMRYRIPFRLDLRKTTKNQESSQSKWLKTILAVVQHSNKSAAMLTRVQASGKRKRYLTVQAIPGDVTGEVKIKVKQYRNNIRTMFAELDTILTSLEVKRLKEILNINIQTMTYREDKYSGDLAVLVGWLLEVNPTLTHTAKL